MTLGEWIRAARDRVGMTQVELGKAAGVHHITLSKWENNHCTPALGRLGKLFAALKTTDIERRAVVDAMQGFGEFPA